jgi:hypothetical protein
MLDSPSMTLLNLTIKDSVAANPTANPSTPATVAAFLIIGCFGAKNFARTVACDAREEKQTARSWKARRRRETKRAVGARGNWSGREDWTVEETERES